MNAISLFSGIGGIDIAAEWAGIKVKAFCEREPFCQKVLKKHWPLTPIYDDVRTLTKERLIADGIIKPGGAIDLVFGGYPCQPFSIAGKRAGENDDRHLWPEVKRILKTVRPRWFIGENVAGHITMGLNNVLLDLGDINYTYQTFIIPASSVGAIHRRDRVFVVANSDSEQRPSDIKREIQGQREIQRSKDGGSPEEWARRSMLFEPKLLRNYHGVPNGMDRNRALGNAVVPQQIYPILAAIKQIFDREGE